MWSQLAASLVSGGLHMRKFKTESKKLLDLMINSIYTNKEIFLRELISNASDAEDKLYLRSLTDSTINLDEDSLAIRVTPDKDAHTLTISDNGLGMTEEELEKNLGTIAHSGSEEFKAENAEHQGDDVDIIGQFGVGFYSAFMVAKEVRVVTRAAGEDVAHEWVSDGLEGYTIADAERDHRGLTLSCILKEDDVEGTDGAEGERYSRFLEEWTLRSLSASTATTCAIPSRWMAAKSRELPKPEDAPEDYKPLSTRSYAELETVNSIDAAVVQKRSSEVEPGGLRRVLQVHVPRLGGPGAHHLRSTPRERIEYDALLFIPGAALRSTSTARTTRRASRSTSSNVLATMEKCADLVPDYFNFVRGVVDSPDVSLNISRETLQQSRRAQGHRHAQVEKKVRARARDDARPGPRGLREVLRATSAAASSSASTRATGHEGLRARRPAALLAGALASRRWLLSPNMRRPCLLVRRPSTMLP